MVIQLLPDDPHSFAASSQLNWLPRRFKWTRPFRCKTKYGVCACAITFQTHNTSQRTLSLNSTNQSLHVEVRMDSPCLRVGKNVCGLQSQLGVGDVLKGIAHYILTSDDNIWLITLKEYCRKCEIRCW